VVTAELPGVSSSDVTISVQQDMLSVRGDRHAETEQEGARWQRRERLYGSFSRAVRLPFRVDPEKVQARFNNGILEIELHRPDADRARKIEVRAGS
jgi:HSP20 family protein